MSLVRYYPKNRISYELPFRPFSPNNIINICRYAFKKYLDRFDTVELFKTFLRRLSEQIMAQYIEISNVHERIYKLHMWWCINEQFLVKDDYSVQKLLDIFFK
ncbi:unnamed protein product [Rotaria socialis]|uniref:Uncharacterized protein n=1 Tax=Rotaria socialis TaxID=392032 RepID=A0A818KDQ7_9BILA|nr:unnamed protein product [Rotaria socialis]